MAFPAGRSLQSPADYDDSSLSVTQNFCLQIKSKFVRRPTYYALGAVRQKRSPSEWKGCFFRNELDVGCFHALGDVAVAVIDFVNLLEAIQRGRFVAHLGMDEALFVKDFLFGIVHGDEVGESV